LGDEATGHLEHACAITVAVPAVQIRNAGGCTVRFSLLIQIHAMGRVAVTLVIVVTHMRCFGPSLMHAIASHRRPGELEGQENQQQDA
jgi:hypothetical protein